MGLACFVWQLTRRRYENDLKDRNDHPYSIFNHHDKYLSSKPPRPTVCGEEICVVSVSGDLFIVINHHLLELCEYVVTRAIALSHCERTPCAVSIVTNPRRFYLVIVLSCVLGMISNEGCDTIYKTGKEECLHES